MDSLGWSRHLSALHLYLMLFHTGKVIHVCKGNWKLEIGNFFLHRLHTGNAHFCWIKINAGDQGFRTFWGLQSFFVCVCVCHIVMPLVILHSSGQKVFPLLIYSWLEQSHHVDVIQFSPSCCYTLPKTKKLNWKHPMSLCSSSFQYCTAAISLSFSLLPFQDCVNPTTS